MDETAPLPEPSAKAPPHPFRAAAWYDPRLEHRPCMCPRCRPPGGGRPRLRPLRIAVCVIGGALWPLAALLCNTAFHVVALGKAGTAALLLAILASLANLALHPTRRDPATRRVEVSGPRRTSVRAALLLGALWGCLCWGYLGLLMLPLVPISLLAILWMGLGLCGLTPFAALAVAIVQALRAGRGLSERLGRRAAALTCVGALLLPLLLGAAAGLHARRRRGSLEAELARIAAAEPHSEERLRVIAALAGREDELPRTYLRLAPAEERRAAAEAYLLLSDRRLNEQVEQLRERRSLIRPLWFLDGGSPLNEAGLGSFWRM